MKKGIFTLALVMFCLVAANAQADYKMYIQLSLEPNLDQITLFEKNLAEHNKKYHSEGFMKAEVWKVLSATNSGQYALWMGPLTFSDFDTREEIKGHDADWNDNVLALCKWFQNLGLTG